MSQYLRNNGGELLRLSLDHLTMTFISLGLACLFAGVLVFFCYDRERLRNLVTYLASAFYSIPSFGLFALLIPLTGLGKTTAILGLAIYSQYILVRTFFNALLEVDRGMVEAAYGMGMTRNQVLRKISLPLALGPILTGIKLAATSTIGIATIAATINAGGLGTLLFEGLRTRNVIPMVYCILITAGLCLLVNVLLGALYKALKKG